MKTNKSFESCIVVSILQPFKFYELFFWFILNLKFPKYLNYIKNYLKHIILILKFNPNLDGRLIIR